MSGLPAGPADKPREDDERNAAIWDLAERHFDPDRVLTNIEFAECYGESVQFAQDMVGRFAARSASHVQPDRAVRGRPVSGEQWRVGRRNPHNVYLQHGSKARGMNETDGDTSLGYFRLTGDAATAVAAVNAVSASESPAPTAASGGVCDE